MSNYRPISVLPLISKVFERCIYNRLLRFLRQNRILNPNQFGFQKGKSTLDALLNFVENVCSELNSKKHVVGISIDFSKAFDTVNHHLLLRKLYAYGIRGLPLEWFKSYLNGRTQRVRIGDSYSEPKNISCGVPQGSIIGPILFLLYINDLPLIVGRYIGNCI